MKLRAPPLPIDLEASWDYFLETLPDWLWARYTTKNIGVSTGTAAKAAPGKVVKNHIGERLITMMKDVQTNLGDHYVRNPCKPEPAPKKTKLGGNPEAFNEWMQSWLNVDRKKAKAFAL